MKIFKVIVVILFVLGLILAGYKAYGLYVNWQDKQNNEIAFLRQNQSVTLEKISELSTTLAKVVNETVKVQTLPKDNATYEELKKEVLELKENEEENKDKIEELKEQLSTQRQAFLNSSDRIYIKTKEDDTLLVYRDEDDVLQPASDNIEKIIEHRDISEISTKEVPMVEKKKDIGVKAGFYYDISETKYGGIFSKEIFDISKYSFNVSALVNFGEIKDIKAGGDIGYAISDRLEAGLGVNNNKDIYFKLQYCF